MVSDGQDVTSKISDITVFTSDQTNNFKIYITVNYAKNNNTVTIK